MGDHSDAGAGGVGVRERLRGEVEDARDNIFESWVEVRVKVFELKRGKGCLYEARFPDLVVVC